MENLQNEAILLESLCINSLGDRKCDSEKQFLLLRADNFRRNPYLAAVFISGAVYDESNTSLCTKLESLLDEYSDKVNGISIECIEKKVLDKYIRDIKNILE
jgi:hypothetical protein|nr:MAG TPA: hypothetical protein [Caudoviricetes sp.]